MLKGKLILKRAIRKPNAGKKLLDLLWHICSKLSRNPKKRRDISEKTAMRRADKCFKVGKGQGFLIFDFLNCSGNIFRLGETGGFW